MNTYKFTKEDFLEALEFTTLYHLEETKQSRGRTNSGERGYGGELDSFISGKLTEKGVAKILENYSEKNLKFEIDNEIYTDSEIGRKSDPDITKVILEDNIEREPKIHLEIKKINEELDEWVGMRGDQYESLVSTKGNIDDKIFIINASLKFDDNLSKKSHDIVGSLLKELIQPAKSDPISKFSNYHNLRCKINYIYSMEQLKEYGVFYPKKTIMTSPVLKTGKNAYLKKGGVAKGFTKLGYSPKGKYKRNMKLKDSNEVEFFSNWDIDGAFEVFHFGKNNEYLYLTEDTCFKNDVFGNFNFKKGTTVKFFFINKLRTTKSIDDYWFARIKLDQLIEDKKIPSVEKGLAFIAQNI